MAGAELPCVDASLGREHTIDELCELISRKDADGDIVEDSRLATISRARAVLPIEGRAAKMMDLIFESRQFIIELFVASRNAAQFTFGFMKLFKALPRFD